jgi:HAD superfamily PSPase-like hydrolase
MLGRPKGLVAFDMDGTLLTGTPSWEMLHAHYSTLHVAQKAHRDYSEHRITYEQFMRRDLGAWPRPLRRSELLEVLSGFKLRPEAPAVVADLRLMGYEPAIVTSALDLLAEMVSRKLGIKYFMANRVGFDARGNFDGRVYPMVEPLKKHEAFLKLVERLGVGLDATAAVGDTEYDSTFLKSAGRGFVIGDEGLASRLGVTYIRDLRELLSYLDPL